VRWQVQEAKQRFSEVLRRAKSDGPQIVTRHGEEVAVIIEATEFHKLAGDTADFKAYLRAGPSFDDLDLSRSRDLPREIDWAAQEQERIELPARHQRCLGAAQKGTGPRRDRLAR
jgi:antitoxin Phd